MMVCGCALMFNFFSALPDSVTIEYEIQTSGFSDFLRTLNVC